MNNKIRNHGSVSTRMAAVAAPEPERTQQVVMMARLNTLSSTHARVEKGGG